MRYTIGDIIKFVGGNNNEPNHLRIINFFTVGKFYTIIREENTWGKIERVQITCDDNDTVSFLIKDLDVYFESKYDKRKRIIEEL